ncbi:MAG: transporter substrate-binding domain-containing protein, partial [Silvanigrellaceae bacterium]|nr:transporter substrate-binding domain-containing protein [Silvanigrellaceae bacterium]
MRRIVFNLLLLTTLFAHFSEACGLSETLRAITADFPPFEFLQDGKVFVVDTDVIRAVAQRIGFKDVKFEMTTWENAQVEARQGNYDILYTFVRTEAREKIFYFTDTLLMTRRVLFKRKNDKITWNKISELGQYKIGVSRGYDYGNEFSSALEKKQINVEDAYGDTPELTNLLKVGLGKIDLFPCEINVCSYILGKNKRLYDVFSNIDYIDKSVTLPEPGVAGFPKTKESSADLQKRFNHELKNFKRTEEYKAIFRKYN